MPLRLPSYNPPVHFPRSKVILSAALLCLALASSCDYPEQGFFLLSGSDASGKVLVSHVFEVVELVDDTDLTYGFTIHVYDPQRKIVIDLPFDNIKEYTRRGWLFGLRDSDYGAGDLALDLTHDEQMIFVGAWRESRNGRAWPLAGRVLAPEHGRSNISFSLPLPSLERPIVNWTVEPLSTKAVNERLGKLSAYKRVKGAQPEDLDAQLGLRELEAQTALAQPVQPTTPQEPGRRYTPPPPLGGKR